MGMPSEVVAEVYKRLDRISALAKEIEEVPNFGPDLWTMKEVDKKCQQIRNDASWIRQQTQHYIGTGS